MPHSNPNTALIEKAYREWNESKGKSVATWLAMLAPDFSIRSLGEGRPGGEFAEAASGPEEVKRYFDTLLDHWSMIHWTLEECIAEGDRVAIVGRCGWTNKATGKSIDTPIMGLWRFKDGKAVDYLEVYDTHRMVEAATP